MPTLKIRGYRQIAELPTAEIFKTKTADDKNVKLLVKKTASGDKFFLLQSFAHILGWTEDANIAFDYFLNVGCYELRELVC